MKQEMVPNKLRISNLPDDLEADQLCADFRAAGWDVAMVRYTGSHGAFKVRFGTVEQAALALETLHGKEAYGRKMAVHLWVHNWKRKAGQAA